MQARYVAKLRSAFKVLKPRKAVPQLVQCSKRPKPLVTCSSAVKHIVINLFSVCLTKLLIAWDGVQMGGAPEVAAHLERMQPALAPPARPQRQAAVAAAMLKPSKHSMP